MKVLLLSMPDCTPLFNLKRWRPPNLAMASLVGNLEGHDVRVGDLILNRENVKRTLTELINDYKPDVVGTSAMSFQFATAQRIAALAKSIKKEIVTVLGGYHPTLLYDEICASDDSKPFDYIIRGEGESSFAELLDALQGKRGLDTVMGLSYRNSDTFTHNPHRPVEDLEKLKLPDRTKRLWRGNNFNGYILDIVETSRGCTMPCNFCCMEKMYGKSFRAYSIPRVIEDIGNCKKLGTGYIIFSDDNICLNIKRFEDLCDAIVAAGHNDISYIVQASSSGIASSDTLAEKMARAGFKIVFLGIENVAEENLRRLKKGNIINSTRIAVKKLHENNMLVTGGIILGNPEDKEEAFASNYRFLKELDADFYADQILTPYPRTPIRGEMLQMGLVTNKENYRRYNTFWANVRTNYLSPDEIQFLRWKYNKLYADNMLATKTFIRNHPLTYLMIAYFWRPLQRLRNFLFGKNLTERESYEIDMQKAEEMNSFPDLYHDDDKV
ncbi:MAG: B12-binding domain-containing radical SAM protein [Candidatus Brocadiales bacterium]